MTSKTVLIGVAVVAVLAILYFVIGGFPPKQEGTEATIGVAERHQTEQIQASDVVLEDAEFQEFLQSDVVQRLIENKEN